MTRTRVLLRCDVGRHHGLGHLQRTIALAEALTDRDAEVILVLVGEVPPSDVFGLSRFAMIHTELAAGSEEEMDWLISEVQGDRVDFLVVDSYLVDARYLMECMKTGGPVAMIDDMAALDFPCELVVGPNAYAESLTYRGSPTTLFLLGPRFVLLRREFWSPPHREIRDGPHLTYLVTVGGADPSGIAVPIAETLAKMDPESRVILVEGPFFEHRDDVEPLANNIEVTRAPASLQPLLERCDLTISSAGQTLLEMAAIGVPAIALETATNQSQNLAALEGAGTVLRAGGVGDEGLIESVELCVRKLASDTTLRAQMSANGRRLIDGRGAQRVAETILTQATGSS